ncbi:uncharacterized protein JCM6883_001953 [Sporobolomyces salmoneus]|uniref:uncharacterized protein n=1 Tax=Sporobolomyces salmoneus TaxID=183962 RepID=UPI0031764F04
MGVRDLFPTLRKLVPNSIKPIDSLSQLPPSKFAIDGNLLTTKFHFSPVTSLDGSPPPNRHVKGWYSFLRELEKRGIEAVVVFDGEGRKVEKEKERRRRKEARELQRLRGEAEMIRMGRLKSLKEIWDRETDRMNLGERDEALEAQTAEAEESPNRERSLWELYDEYEKDRGNPVYSKNQELITKGEGEFYDSILRRTSLPEPIATNTDQPKTASQLPVVRKKESIEPPIALPDEPTFTETETETPSSRIPLVSPPTPLSTTQPPTATPSPLVQSASEHPSKSSHLVAEIEPTSALPPPPDLPEEVPPSDPLVEYDLNTLISKSSQLSKSHLSRSVSVPSHVFSDVKDLIAAMGYPVLTPSSSNPFEAESICSLLYHSRSLTGITHIVSEDTDVLVYSAPLLRRITTSEGNGFEKKTKKGYEMSVTDPEEVRRGLGLERREFTDWCLLCGTDFTERLPLLGPSKALGLIREHGSIEAVFEDARLRAKYFPPSPPPPAPSTDERDNDLDSAPTIELVDSHTKYREYIETVKDARRIFLELPELGDVIREAEALNVLNDEEARHRVSEEAKEELEWIVSSEWFAKKEERKEELETLKRRFGISRGGWNGTRVNEVASGWVETVLELEDEEEIYGDGFEEEAGFLAENEADYLERYQEEEWRRSLDERAADIWLREQELGTTADTVA